MYIYYLILLYTINLISMSILIKENSELYIQRFIVVH